MTCRDATRVPSNLSRQVLDDLRHIFQYSRRHFAPAITRRTRTRLVARFIHTDVVKSAMGKQVVMIDGMSPNVRQILQGLVATGKPPSR